MEQIPPKPQSPGKEAVQPDAAETADAAPAELRVRFLMPLEDVEGLPVPVFEELNRRHGTPSVGWD